MTSHSLQVKVFNERCFAGETMHDEFATAAYEPYPEFDVEQDREARHWAMALHLSQFAGYLIPFGGFLVPFFIWQLKKDTLPGIDDHGREVMNWIITEVIYFVFAIILCFVLVGVPLLIMLGLMGVIYPIIGAIKASDGAFWKYPLTIRML